MKTSELKKFMALVSKLNVKNPTLEACGYLLHSNGVLQCFDLEGLLTMNTDFGNEIFTVPVKLLLEVLKSADAKSTIMITPITIFVNNVVVMQYTGIDVSLMPELRIITPTTQKHFRFLIQPKVIAGVIKFASKNELRPVMNNVVYDKENYAATDGNVLCFEKATPTTCEGFPDEVLFSRKLISLFPSDETIWIDYYYVNEIMPTPEELIGYNIFNFNHDNIQVKIIGSSGKFPSYKAVIPQQQYLGYSINKKALKNAITLAMTACNKTTNFAIFDFGFNQINISASDIDMGTSCNLIVKDGVRRTIKPINGVTQEVAESFVFRIGFNLKYLLAAVNYVDDVAIRMTMDQPNRATIINERVLVMPAHIKP